MPDTKISALTELAEAPAQNDVLPLTDTSASTTKKIQFSNLSKVRDDSFEIQDNLDTTKKIAFQASSITAATTRTVTVPDADLTMVGTATTQTLTNKTIAGASNTLTVREADLSFTDLTTANASAANHGLLLKLDNVSTNFLNGTGAWSAPAGGGDLALISRQAITAAPTSITWSAIAAGYKAFLVEIVSIPSAGSNLRCWLNNDTGANRYWSAGGGGGTNAWGVAAQSSVTLWYINQTGGNWGSTARESASYIWIHNNADKAKMMCSQTFNGNSVDTHVVSGFYSQTAEINRIDLDLGGTNTFGNKTYATLWGLK